MEKLIYGEDTKLFSSNPSQSNNPQDASNLLKHYTPEKITGYPICFKRTTMRSWLSDSWSWKDIRNSSPPEVSDSLDLHPWNHPFLNRDNLVKVREFSEEVWTLAESYLNSSQRMPKAAFCVNMAQNMYNWARLARRHGAEVTLFTHPQDGTAISKPEWEEFEGEWPDIFDGEGFLNANPGIELEAECIAPPNCGKELLTGYDAFLKGDRAGLLKLVTAYEGIRLEPFFAYEGAYPYWEWTKLLNAFEVIYIASVPIAAYLSGRPYCAVPVGGDLQFDCGRADGYGCLMSLAFAGARFLVAGNPHQLGNCRRLGLTNGMFLPYIIDTQKYSPAEGRARKEWNDRFGEGFYVLSTTRLDFSVKGVDYSIFDRLVEFIQKYQEVKFIFLRWGKDAERLSKKAKAQDLERNIIFLPTVGKRRLIDYYRSADCVLDQLIYGYYSATSLEAMATSKPVIMKIRQENYHPLYNGDVPPILNVKEPKDIVRHLEDLYHNPDYRRDLGENARRWLVKNHSDTLLTRRLLGLLALTADRVPLPSHLKNPLIEPLSSEERKYHRTCLVPVSTKEDSLLR